MRELQQITDDLDAENPRNAQHCKALIVEALRALDSRNTPETCPEPIRSAGRDLQGNDAEQ